MKLTIEIKKLLFYCAWVLYMVYYVIFRQSMYSNLIPYSIRQFTRFLPLILAFLIILLYRRFDRKYLIFITACFVLVFASFLSSGASTMLTTLFFSVSVAGFIDEKDFLKHDIQIRVVILIFIFLSIALGVIQNNEAVINNTTKMTLGFTQANVFGMYVGALISEYVASKNRIRIREFLIVSIVMIALTSLGISRTASIAVMLMLIVALIIQSSVVRCIISRLSKLIALFPAFLAILSYVVCAAYNTTNGFLAKLNLLLTTRLAWGHYYIQKYGVSLFGKEIEIVGSSQVSASTSYATLDMSYVRILLEYGLVGAFIFVLAYSFAIYWVIRTERWNLLPALFYFSVVLCIANSGLVIVYNWPLLFMFVFFREFFANANDIAKSKCPRTSL